MQTEVQSPSVSPPGIITSLVEGFQTVANHVYLILFPVALDIFLWLGPQLRVRTVLQPLMADYSREITSVFTRQNQEIIAPFIELWETLLAQFNLFSILRAYPVGITSLLANQGVTQTPFGLPIEWEISSVAGLLVLILVLAIEGIFLGCLYFSKVANFHPGLENHNLLKNLLQNSGQLLLFIIGLTFILMLMLVPAVLLLTFMALISPAIAEFGFLAMGLLLLWTGMPLIFSPHGILVLRQNAVSAALVSMRMVRVLLPATSGFILVLLLMSQGFDILWSIPPDSSWLMLVGIVGHGFISTALIASSFSFYLNGVRWMQARQRSAETAVRSASN